METNNNNNNNKNGIRDLGVGVGFCTAGSGGRKGNLAHLGDGHDLSLPRAETRIH